MTTMKVVKMSVCECGYPLWHDVVKPGDTYQVDIDSAREAYLECGKCQTKTLIHAVFAVNSRDKGWVVLEALGEVVQ